MSGLRRLVLLAATLVAAPLMAGATAQAADEIACGAPIKSVTRTNSVFSFSSDTNPNPVPGAAIVINVPAGAHRCIKVVFTAASACGPSPANDQCFIRARDNGVLMSPNVSFFDSEDGAGSSHSLAWVRKVGPGSHRIAIQRSVGDDDTSFGLLGWVLDVTVTKL
jgi:hypothetical protein